MSEPTAAELLKDVGLKAKNLKCFGEEPQGFDRIMPINVIIGRNNSGKSALVDLVEYAVRGPYDRWQNRGRSKAEAYYSRTFLLGDVDGRYRTTVMVEDGNRRAEVHPYNIAREILVNKRAVGIMDNNHHAHHLVFDVDMQNRPWYESKGVERVGHLLQQDFCKPIRLCKMYRLAADRDIKREREFRGSSLEIDDNGDGFTQVVEAVLGSKRHDRLLVEQMLLDGLNKVFATEERQFRRILAQYIEPNEKEADSGRIWEIELEETDGAIVPLSQMGSGVKTTLLVLSKLLLLPKLEPVKEGDVPVRRVFAFEELENNLHPALQRQLFSYIRDRILETGDVVFLTTHSNVVIDLFSKDEHAQIVHVTRQESESRATTIKLHEHGNVLLDDLGVRASDLLQTNIVLWVEGPSDRIYLNRWIELASNSELKQGTHYQCVFYGGALLAHYLMSDGSPDPDADDGEELVEAMRVCRKAMLIADSDKDAEEKPIKPRVQKAIEGLATTNGLSWVTHGREIENYIPKRILSELGVNVPEKERRFAKIFDKVKNQKKCKHKVELALAVAQSFNEADFADAYDLRDRIDEVVREIRIANGMHVAPVQSDVVAAEA
jgi:putative ATP-dependent endonuclease of OLD family